MLRQTLSVDGVALVPLYAKFYRLLIHRRKYIFRLMAKRFWKIEPSLCCRTQRMPVISKSLSWRLQLARSHIHVRELILYEELTSKVLFCWPVVVALDKLRKLCLIQLRKMIILEGGSTIWNFTKSKISVKIGIIDMSVKIVFDQHISCHQFFHLMLCFTYLVKHKLARAL